MIADAKMRFAPPNAILYLVDAEHFDPPDVDGHERLWRSESCIIIGCRADVDGPTEISVNAPGAPPPDLVMVGSFDQAVPSRRLVLTIVPDTVIHEMELERPAAHVEVWTDGAVDPAVVWLKIT